ncbi:hypothetical protein EG68_09482 [Paragonimus skrjabini miyazakii]|uniref:Uncharacterized protein n=1 Tax=Paragonimus skrjabini miyazakii TaxID=59628 RepID=A0A8S9YTR9_9TREM|nr:hypothetical protein EG68_09482 [Paragonimus skrjabini miyazakii]
MIGNSPQSQDFSLSRIIAQIVSAREQHTTYILVTGTDEVEPKPDTHFWFALFQHAFLISESHDACASGPRDDLLFFVSKKTTVSSKPKLIVLRKNSPKVPKADDMSIDWEETVYLNLLMQYTIPFVFLLNSTCPQFVYVVTVAVCTRTGLLELEILKKFSETVYASPNRRRMDSKGNREEMVYPNLFFSLENYDEIFTNCVLRDGECLCVELTAYDLNGCLQGVCFLGTIEYTSIKSFYDSKSGSLPHRDNVGFLGRHFGSVTNNAYCSSRQPAQQSRVKFLQVLGPHSIGLVELAISVVDGLPKCLCGRSAGFDLLSRCCSCQTAAPVDRHFSEVSPSNRLVDSKAVTEQPEKSTIHPDDQWLTDHTFSNWVDLSVDCERRNLSHVNSNSIEPLHSVPWFAKSAGASTSTSPVRQWRQTSVTSDVGENTSANRPGWIRASQLRTKRGYVRRDSRVSDILGRFIPLNENSPSQSRHPRPSSELHLDDLERTAVAGMAVRTGRKNDAEKENTESSVTENNLISQICGRNRHSLDQSWAWFKERRRIASVGLNAALTFLSLPCHGILSDLIETRREPILTITD